MDHPDDTPIFEDVDTPERRARRLAGLRETFPALTAEMAELVDNEAIRSAHTLLDAVMASIGAFNKTNTHEEHGTCLHVPFAWTFLRMLEVNISTTREQIDHMMFKQALDQLMGESGFAMVEIGPENIGDLDTLLRTVLGEPSEQPFGRAASNEGERKPH